MDKIYTLLFTTACTKLFSANKITISKLSLAKENNPYIKFLAHFNIFRENTWRTPFVTNFGDTARVFVKYPVTVTQ